MEHHAEVLVARVWRPPRPNWRDLVALVLIIAMGVGGFMPLAGVGFYVCCTIMKCDIEQASRAMTPYLVTVLIGLVIVAFVPWLALFLPRYFGLGG